MNWFVQRQNIFQIRLDEFTDLNPDSNSTRRYNYTKMFWRVTFQIGAKINCAQKIKTSGVWTEGKPEQLRPWFVRCKIQGELEGGGNCFWHWKDIELLCMLWTSYFQPSNQTHAKTAAEWMHYFLCLLLLFSSDRSSGSGSVCVSVCLSVRVSLLWILHSILMLSSSSLQGLF